MVNYNFVKFDGVYHRGDNNIAINKSGLIRLSSGFCREIGTLTKYIVLFFDVKNNLIAFKLTNVQEKGALKISPDKDAGTVSAKSFFSANQLDLNKISGRFTWKKQTVVGLGELLTF